MIPQEGGWTEEMNRHIIDVLNKKSTLLADAWARHIRSAWAAGHTGGCSRPCETDRLQPVVQESLPYLFERIYTIKIENN
jgi:hypothetical protein